MDLTYDRACFGLVAAGANLNAMMMQSGAVLMLHPANPKADRILEITGTTPQVTARTERRPDAAPQCRSTCLCPAVR